ncbi:MAG: hypothetical protein WCG25_03445 [bacterium]
MISCLYSWIDQARGKKSHLNIFVSKYFVKYSAKTFIHAFLVLSKDSLLTGICFFLSVVPDEAENFVIFHGHIIFSFVLASCIYFLKSLYSNIGMFFENNLYLFDLGASNIS